MIYCEPSPLSFSSSYTSSNGMLTCSGALIYTPLLFSSSIFFLNVQLLCLPLLVASSASWVFTSWEECCTGNWTMVPRLMTTTTTTTTTITTTYATLQIWDYYHGSLTLTKKFQEHSNLHLLAVYFFQHLVLCKLTVVPLPVIYAGQ